MRIRERQNPERDDRLRALRATRPHTVGYIGGRDQEQREIECPGGCLAQVRGHLTQSVFKVVSPMSISTQIRQLIIYISKSEG